jgi:hypothetical protein
MVEFTSDKMIILLTVVFPVMLLAAAVYLGSGICAIMAIMIWIGVAVIFLFLPTTKDSDE